LILGIDPGARRVGVAVGDETTRWAHALEVIDIATVDPVERILELARQRGASAIVVGRPLGLSGRAGPAVVSQRSFVDALRAGAGIPVEEFDERLTTVVAEKRLRSAGASATTRKRVRDAVAAQVMLQDYLDAKGPP
jgi:putative Holliday junction resolvase